MWRCLFCVSLTTSCSAGIIWSKGLRGLNRGSYTLPNTHHVRLEICEVRKLIVSPLVPLTLMSSNVYMLSKKWVKITHRHPTAGGSNQNNQNKEPSYVYKSTLTHTEHMLWSLLPMKKKKKTRVLLKMNCQCHLFINILHRFNDTELVWSDCTGRTSSLLKLKWNWHI